MAANDELESALTRHQVYLQRLGSGTARKVLDALKASETRIVERLLSETNALSRARQEKLLRDLRRVMETAYLDATGALQVDLEALAVYEGEFQTDLFKRVLPVKFETVTPTANQVIAAVNSRPFQGKLLKEVYPELTQSAWRQVRNAIRGGFIEGRTTDQIVRDLRGTQAQGYKDGVLAKTRRDVEAVVRTAVNHTANTAREVTYEVNDDLVKGVRFNATLDGRTTLICASNDGKVFEPGKGPRPPLHYNCRSSTSPVLKSWRELGFDVDEVAPATRASMNGQVPAGQDYDAWLRTQPQDFQDEALGKARADLFRAGTKVDRFVDRSGREYTLDELKRREGATPKATKPKAQPKPKPAPQRFKYEDYKGVNSVAEAESYVRDNGIAATASLKGISPKGVSQSIGAAMEVTERFGLEPLGFMGPIKRDTRHRYRQPRGANAAVYPGTQALHLPTKFGDLKDAQRQIDAKNRQAVHFERERKAVLDSSTRIDPEVRARVEKMAENDYTWSITMSDAASERAKTMYHEYGHVLHMVDKTIGPQIDAFLKAERPRASGWQLLVSKYGGSNDAEYIAETFAIYMTKPKSEWFRIHPKLLEIYMKADKKNDG